MAESVKTWRFIDTGPMDGPANMALDEALLRVFDPHDPAPVFRLYGWKPPSFSFGRYQDADAALDLRKCEEYGVGAVRRMTAGGIIYHADEITYSIVCAPGHLTGVRTVKESFRKLCGFLLATYRKLGLDPRFAVDREESGTLGRRTALCFAGKEEYDITVDGRKIGGNAQLRLKNIIFQHGSIPLKNSFPDAVPFIHDHERPSMPERHTVSLGELKPRAEPGRLKVILAQSLEECLGVTLVESEITPEEASTAERLLAEKYLSASWNREGRKRV